MRLLKIVAPILLAVGSLGTAHAKPITDTESLDFVFGLAALHDQLGAEMGVPISAEHEAEDDSTDTWQETTTGLAYWRSGVAHWTNGWDHAAWLPGHGGLVRWSSGAVDVPVVEDETLSLRAATRAVSSLPIAGAVARADCIIDRESHGRDVPNAQDSGALGPGQYMPGTWAAHVALYRAATGYVGSLSLHVLADVRRVMAFVLAADPTKRAAWSVGGCR